MVLGIDTERICEAHAFAFEAGDEGLTGAGFGRDAAQDIALHFNLKHHLAPVGGHGLFDFLDYLGGCGGLHRKLHKQAQYD